MTFKGYYSDEFRSDFKEVIAAMPKQDRHIIEADDVVLQPHGLSQRNSVINSWNKQRLELFATALYFTTLVDQVCYTHYQDSYPQFRSLTRYPKFKGDCPGACNINLHPNSIFRVIGLDKVPSAIMHEALPVMEYEVESFVQEYIEIMDSVEFWRKCIEEIPNTCIEVYSEAVYRLLKTNYREMTDIPNKAGVYALFLKEGAKLDKFCPAEDGLIYVGKSTNLANREFAQHFQSGATGQSTVRRSIGAILQQELGLKGIPRVANSINDRDYTNFKFTTVGEIELTDWMNKNLVFRYFMTDHFDSVEKCLIKRSPLLNLQGVNNNNCREIKRLRSECASEARKLKP